MPVDEGQDTARWADDWDGLTPEAQIQIWDFYGLRPYILRYVPRHGKVIEGGCGLGRVLFYLERLGIDIDGVDFEPTTLERLRRWRDANGMKAKLVQADVCDMPYEDNSVAGYISLGVVEHFIEGPHRPLAEAHRVLRPGGVAIITTPSMSFAQAYKHTKTGVKDLVKKVIRSKRAKPPWRQYFYRPAQLGEFVRASGLEPVCVLGADLFYAFYELGYRPMKQNAWVKLIARMERLPLARFGAQSVTISVKMAPEMHCFLCGELNVARESMRHVVPICEGCSETTEGSWYQSGGRIQIDEAHQVEPALSSGGERTCEYCAESYTYHPLFEDHGFTKQVCGTCLRIPRVNLELTHKHLNLIWRDVPRNNGEAGRALAHMAQS